MAHETLTKEIRDSGLDVVGRRPWGTHFCQFYQTQKDLSDTLVSYFKAGLVNNELCVWVTSEFLTKDEAIAAMERAVPDFSRHLEKGQMEIFPYTDWYLKTGKFEMERVLMMWLDKHNQALDMGFTGLRVSGNPFWLDNKKDWDDFTAYESKITNAIRGYKLLVLCTYSLDKCGANEIIDVVINHQFALIKQGGEWKLIESDEYKKTKEALEDSEQRLRNFIAIMGHELRNLITPTVLSLDLIKNKKIEDKEVKKAIETARRQSDNLSALLKDLLDALRMGRGQIKLQERETDLGAVVKNAAAAAKHLFKENKQKLEIEKAVKKIKTIADPLRLEQIFVNLLSNASKYSNKNGAIKVSTGQEGGEAQIKVRDFGIGIAADELKNIFNLFSRLDYSTTQKREGFGVGLYLARELARLHGGDISVVSEGLGKGSEFTVRIPTKM